MTSFSSSIVFRLDPIHEVMEEIGAPIGHTEI